MDSRNDCDFLLQGAIWQDSLLQAYRYLHVTFQSILLAIGTGLFVVSMSSDTFSRTLVATVLLLCLWVLHRFTGRKMQEIVLARGQDVNYWHKELIIAEQQLPRGQRHFTKFKIHQQARRQNLVHLQELFLTDMPIDSKDVDTLIEKGIGHTRQVVDQQLFDRISYIWYIFAIMSVVITIVDTVLFLSGRV